MSKSASAMILSAVAALAAAWLRFHPNHATAAALHETSAAAPEVPATGTAGAVASVTTAQDNATESDTSPAAAQDDGATKTAKAIFDAFDRGVTPTFVAR